MSYSDQLTFVLGSQHAGKTLQAQLRDAVTGNLLAGYTGISTGFTEIGNGFYLWHYDNYPSDIRVIVEVLEIGQTEVLAVSSPIDAWTAQGVIDGVAPMQLAEVLLSYIAGTSTLVDHGNGTKTITYRKQDGVTDRLSVTFDTQGQWLNTNLHD